MSIRKGKNNSIEPLETQDLSAERSDAEEEYSANRKTRRRKTASQTEKIGTLLYIYLPTIEKLLDTYVEIDAKRVDVPNSRKAKSEIAESLKMFNEAFDGILNQFYEEKELDIASDIASIRSLERQKDDS